MRSSSNLGSRSSTYSGLSKCTRTCCPSRSGSLPLVYQSIIENLIALAALRGNPNKFLMPSFIIPLVIFAGEWLVLTSQLATGKLLVGHKYLLDEFQY